MGCSEDELQPDHADRPDVMGPGVGLQGMTALPVPSAIGAQGALSKGLVRGQQREGETQEPTSRTGPLAGHTPASAGQHWDRSHRIGSAHSVGEEEIIKGMKKDGSYEASETAKTKLPVNRICLNGIDVHCRAEIDQPCMILGAFRPLFPIILPSVAFRCSGSAVIRPIRSGEENVLRLHVPVRNIE